MKKLYYEDPYIKTFETELVYQAADEKERVYAVLKETAFYPTGGGQPHDEGALNNIKVVDVEEVEGEIRHYLEGELDTSTTEVSGEIDWKRRFDHMQQHAGQHILSAAFEELYGYKTVSFHLGRETLTIDLEISELPAEHAEEAERLANAIILENRPIESKWVSAEEASKFPLRKKLSVSEDIRLVIIPEFDYNGCGGTHPTSTGQVSGVKILDWERQKKKIRVQFVCGSRILAQLQTKYEITRNLSQLLNAPEKELPSAASRLIENGKDLEKQLEEAKETLLAFEAKELYTAEEGEYVSQVFKGRTIQELQKLARLIASQSENADVILINETADKLQFVCAKGADSESDMKSLSAELLQKINGKGGGNPQFAQGGGEKLMSGEDLLQYALRLAGQKGYKG
ncbi:MULTISPECIES: alanyl-tRNA editing protein [unclassified Cytobacillus]|uniref:alanyl-tRNA editing protein n=1 Tax=unclassified Cytobacillus TaxID=2675268 RepID=UPI00203D1108|nr:DHHA1 domain-containing protein [Cytobacillus sp. AMY 15.2]MCM3092854.1 DHHA1 domain-containing protein [Cytobacillus sp. AMY 15.2]